MSNLLRNIVLDEISLVDSPANQHATVTLFKRLAEKDESEQRQNPDRDDNVSKTDPSKDGDTNAGSPGNPLMEAEMTPTELEKKLGDLESQNEQLKADLAKATTDLEAAQAELEKAEVEKKDEDYIDFDGEQVLKSALPEPVLKRLEKQQKAIEKMQEESEKEALRKRAEAELPNLKGTPDQKGQLLKAVDSLGEEDSKVLVEALKAADAAVSKMFIEVGKSAVDDESTATHKLHKMATDYANEHNVPFESAYAEVTKSGEGAKLCIASRKECQ